MLPSFLYSTKKYGDTASLRKKLSGIMTFPFTLFLIKLSETPETLQNIQLKQTNLHGKFWSDN